MACAGGVHLPHSGETGIICAGGRRDGEEKVHVQFCPLEPTQKRCRGLPGLAQALAHLKILNTGRGILLCKCPNPGLADHCFTNAFLIRNIPSAHTKHGIYPGIAT